MRCDGSVVSSCMEYKFGSVPPTCNTTIENGSRGSESKQRPLLETMEKKEGTDKEAGRENRRNRPKGHQR